jgi:hypothetical protein
VTAATLPAAVRSAPVAGPGYLRGMLWVTWRQHRWPILVGTALTAGLLIWMTVTAAQIQSALAMCDGQGMKCPPATVDAASTKLGDLYSSANYQLNAVVFLPALLGLFWGVPILSREYDQRTLTLAWSQDISPLRWLWAKVAILGLIAAALGAALAGESVHLAQIAHVGGRRSLFEGTLFQAGGWLPLTLALAWFAFGVAAGAAIRRTMPALAVVFAAFIGRTLLMAKLRPGFATPKTQIRDFFANDIPSDPLHPFVSNDMSLDPGGNPPFLDASGHTHAPSQIMIWCQPNTPGPPGNDFLRQCFAQHNIVGVLNKYQPASRMGTFHLIENTANLGVLAVSLVAAWWFVRRTSITG